MFENRREARKANRRHVQLMQVADDVVRPKYVCTVDSTWDIDDLIPLFAGRAFADLKETVDADEAAKYLAAACAKRGITARPTT